jgi:hypothetical protein
MKSKLPYFAALFAVFTAVAAQEPQAIPAEELAKATAVLMDANSRLGELPLKLELAPDLAVGIKAEKVGAVFIPDRRLKAEKADRNEKKNKGAARPVGQLWTLKLAPMENGAPLPKDKLRLVTVGENNKQLELMMFTLGIEKAGKKGFQLALYGKGSAPVLRVPLTAEKSKGATAATMVARKTGDEAGVLELRFLGRYKAEIPVGKQAE